MKIVEFVNTHKAMLVGKDSLEMEWGVIQPVWNYLIRELEIKFQWPLEETLSEFPESIKDL